jgi:hypothetical protein
MTNWEESPLRIGATLPFLLLQVPPCTFLIAFCFYCSSEYCYSEMDRRGRGFASYVSFPPKELYGSIYRYIKLMLKRALMWRACGMAPKVIITADG